MLFNSYSSAYQAKLHGKTQNANESINNIIWPKCPKNIYVQHNVLEMGVASAVINFNDGNCGILNVFTSAGMQASYFTKMFCLKKDESQIQRIKRIKRQINKRNSNEKELGLLEKNLLIQIKRKKVFL